MMDDGWMRLRQGPAESERLVEFELTKLVN